MESTIQDSEVVASDDESQKEVRASTKTYPHVPPRVDAENYQAELPDLLPRPSHQSRNATELYFMPDLLLADSPIADQVSDFIAAVRNIFDADRLHNSTWKHSYSSMPLESDEEIFKYLSLFNFDTEAALNSLKCFLGYGKEVVHIRKIADVVEKHPAGFVWSEYKDRIILPKSSKMLGAFHSQFVPRAQANEDVQANEISEEEVISTSHADESASDNTEDDSNQVASYVADRVLGSRSASDSKTEKAVLKKSWQTIHKSVDELLSRALTQCYLPTAPLPLTTAALLARANLSGDGSNSSSAALGDSDVGAAHIAVNRKHAPRATVEEALPILEEAARLPAYINSPGESVGEVIRTMLGELMKHVMEAKIWAAEVRDALHGPARKDQATTLAQLRRLLKQGEDTLRVIPLQEYLSFRRVLNEAKLISREAKYVLSCFGHYFTMYGNGKGFAGSTEENLENSASNGEVDGEFEEEDDEESVANDKSSKNKSTGSTTSRRNNPDEGPAKDFNMDYLTILINRFESIPSAPVLRRELPALNIVQEQMAALLRDVEEILVKADTCAFRKYKQPIENSNRHNLDFIITLLGKLEAVPIAFPQFEAVKVLYSKVIEWKEEVKLLFSDATTTSTSASNRNARVQTQNPNKAVNLKKVESLLETGEKFPFDVETELNMLREKRLQAKTWLEKLKKSFLVKTTRVGPSRRGGDGGSNPSDRINLNDMRMMVEEGSQMFESEDGESVGRASTQVRELSKAQTVVEIAEEWIARMRDLINSDVDEDGNIIREREMDPETNAASDDKKKRKRREEGEDKDIQGSNEEDVDGEDDDDDDESVVNLRELLRDMLKEAEGMPVQMDEVQIIKVHLQALDWAEKFRSVLRVPKSFVDSIPQLLGANAFETVKVSTDLLGEVIDKENKPTFARIVELASDIKRIRAQQINAVESFTIRPIAEELYCAQLTAAVEHWTQQVKRLLLSNSVKKGTKLSKLSQLYSECSKFPVKLTSESRPLVAAITAAEEWLQRFLPLLNLLDIPNENSTFLILSSSANKTKSSSSSSDEDDAAETGTESATMQAQVEAAAGKDEAAMVIDSDAVASVHEDLGETGNGVRLEVLSKAVRSAENIAADFSELKLARDRLAAADAWLQQVSEKCPSKFLSSIASATAVTRRKASSSSTSSSSSITSSDRSGFATDLSANVFKVSNRTVQQLESLVAEGLSLRIDFSEEILALNQAIEECNNWSEQMHSAVAALDQNEIHALVSKYISAMTEDANLLGLSSEFDGQKEGQAADSIVSVTTFAEMETMNRLLHSASAPVANISNGVKYISPIEKSIWDQNTSVIRDRILQAQAQCASLGILTDAAKCLNTYAIVLHWLHHVRSIVFVEVGEDGHMWSDISIEVVESLIKFGVWLMDQQDLSSDGLKAFDDLYQNLPLLAQFNNCEPETELETALTASSSDSRSKRGRNEENIGANPTSKRVKSEGESQSVEGNTIGEGIDGAAEMKTGSDDDESEQEGDEDEHGDDDDEGRDQDGDNDESVSAASRPKRQKKPVEKEDIGSLKPSARSKSGSRYSRPTSSSSSTQRKKTSSSASSIKVEELSPSTPATTGALASTNSKSSRKPKNATDPENSSDHAILNEYYKLQQLVMRWQRSSSAAGHENRSVLHHNILTLVDLWLRFLKIFSRRLQVATRWNNEAKLFLVRLENINVTSAKGLTLEFSRLLLTADALNLHSKIRGQLTEGILAAKSWVTKADAIIRQRDNKQFFTLDGLKDFIKLGEKHLGMLVIADCCELAASGHVSSSTAPATAPTTPVKDEDNASDLVTDGGQDHDSNSNSSYNALALSSSSSSLSRFISSISPSLLNSVGLLQSLRGELKKGKQWITKLQQTGADKGAAVAAEVLEPLLAEIDTICVDFSEQRASLEQGTLRYCFCRQAFHGQMVGCEECDDWFHYNCINLTKAQADKIDKYICLRCTIRHSFHTTAVTVAMITNRWMSNDDLMKWREMRRSKAIKKKVKEEREIHRLQVQINELTDTIRNRYGKAVAATAADNTAMNVESEAGATAALDQADSGAASAVTSSIESMITEQTRPLKEQIRSTQVNLQIAVDEENALLKELELEKTKVPMIREWMQAMQGVLWPNNREDLEIGKPLEPHKAHGKGSLSSSASSSSCSTSASNDEFSVAELGLDRGLLSEGMQKAQCAAVALNIHMVDDVVCVFEGFKWMSWLSLFLHALRRPMPTRALRLFIETYKPLRFQDEKIVKLLQFWYQKASTWKARARKVCSGKTIDAIKVAGLVTEAVTIPFISRSKQQLKAALEGSASVLAAIADSEASQSTQATSKRGSKPPASLTSSSATLTINEPILYTSEEEKLYPNKPVTVRYNFAGAAFIAAPEPKPMWPVERIPFGPVVPLAISAQQPVVGVQRPVVAAAKAVIPIRPGPQLQQAQATSPRTPVSTAPIASNASAPSVVPAAAPSVVPAAAAAAAVAVVPAPAPVHTPTPSAPAQSPAIVPSTALSAFASNGSVTVTATVDSTHTDRSPSVSADEPNAKRPKTDDAVA